MNRNISLAQLKQLIRHPEYGGGTVGDMTEERLQTHKPDWQGNMDELTADIAQNGIQEPLKVYETEAGERFLDNGHHRAVAAMKLGLKRIPVEIEKENG
jgi:ParB-like chromosome segregation protein Spo0J